MKKLTKKSKLIHFHVMLDQKSIDLLRKECAKRTLKNNAHYTIGSIIREILNEKLGISEAVS